MTIEDPTGEEEFVVVKYKMYSKSHKKRSVITNKMSEARALNIMHQKNEENENEEILYCVAKYENIYKRHLRSDKVADDYQGASSN